MNILLAGLIAIQSLITPPVSHDLPKEDTWVWVEAEIAPKGSLEARYRAEYEKHLLFQRSA